MSHLTGSEFRLTPLKQFSRGGRWRTEAMRSYSQPVLYWFTRGQGRLTVQGVTRSYGPNNAVLLPSGTMHGFDVMAQVDGSVLFLPRNPDLALFEVPLHLRLNARQQSELSVQIENIRRELALGAETEQRALWHHAGLLAIWLDRQALARRGVTELTGGCAADRLASAYAALLERDFRSARTVADYAGALGVTPTHLSRSCKAACGRTASELLRDRLHYEARKLLHDTRMPIKEVARSLGFTSAAYFTRAFQQQTGQTPSAFRGAPGARQFKSGFG